MNEELILTKEQKEYLDKRGPLKASVLQRVYKKSVEDQQDMLKQAEKIRAQKSAK
jgi:hypothetical protein